MEQCGCIHTNMDLYKWSYKFYPWISSAILTDAFLLAYEARELDMRASPYDVSAYGFEAIPIETEAGRETYRAMQRDIARKSHPIRQRLIAEYKRVLSIV